MPILVKIEAYSKQRKAIKNLENRLNPAITVAEACY